MLPLWETKPTGPPGNGFDARSSSALESKTPRQFGPTRSAPAARTRAVMARSRSAPSGPSSPNPAAIATSAFAPAASDASTASSSPCAGTLRTTSSGASGRSAIVAVDGEPEELAAAAPDEEDTPAVLRLRRVAREPVPPLRRVRRDADDRDRARLEERGEVAAHFPGKLADGAPGAVRAGQGGVRVAQPLDAAEDAVSRRGHPAAGSVDVEEHHLGRRDRLRLAVAQEHVEDVQPLLVAAEHLRRHVDGVARGELAQVREVRLDREVAAARGEILGVDADRPQQRVARVAEQLQVAALVDVAVVVDPVGGHPRTVEAEQAGAVQLRARRTRRSEEPALPFGEGRAGSGLVSPQCLEHGDEDVVTRALELPHGSPGRLLVGLRRDPARRARP